MPPTRPASSARERRAWVQADPGLGLGSEGPLPTRLAPTLRFTTPLGALLAQSRPEFLLPGFGQLANDSIVSSAVNPAFVEAFLVGANDQWDERNGLARDPGRAACDRAAPVLGLRRPGRPDQADTRVEQDAASSAQMRHRWPARAAWRC